MSFFQGTTLAAGVLDTPGRENGGVPVGGHARRNTIRTVVVVAALSASVSLELEGAPTTEASMVTVAQEEWGRTREGEAVQRYTFRTGRGLVAKVTTYGAILTELQVPDGSGQATNVVLGFDTLERYLQGHPAFGATIGRFANRIARARFTLDGQEYRLAANSGAHHIHGGRRGFDKVVWNARVVTASGREAAVAFSYRSPDGEEGYPGNLDVTVTYVVTADHELRIEYRASTDKPTAVNLTNHSYFNLAGTGDVLGHELLIPAEQYTPADADLIPTGAIAPVRGTPLDFTTPTAIGARIAQLKPRPNGYDHNYVLPGGGGTLIRAARVTEPKSGRMLEVWTTEPGMQLYTANWLDGATVGVGGVRYVQHGGFCLETQHYPDSINQPQFPSPVLRPGQVRQSTTAFRFSHR